MPATTCSDSYQNSSRNILKKNETGDEDDGWAGDVQIGATIPLIGIFLLFLSQTPKFENFEKWRPCENVKLEWRNQLETTLFDLMSAIDWMRWPDDCHSTSSGLTSGNDSARNARPVDYIFTVCSASLINCQWRSFAYREWVTRRFTDLAADLKLSIRLS